MAVIALEEAANAIALMAHEVARDPQSPAASYSVADSARHIDEFLASPELEAILRWPPERRQGLAAQLMPSARRLFESLGESLSVGIQVEQLGGRVDWTGDLADVMDRLERAFAELGVVVDRSWKSGPPIVTRMGTGADGLPRISIATRSYREPRLAPYIERALRDARPSEIEPGRWYAELDAFPGVWADGGTSAECLEALADVLHEWLVLKIIFEDRDVPVLDDLDPRTLVLPIRPPS